MMGWDWTTFFFVLIIGVLVLAFFLALFWAISGFRKKRKEPSHLQLYFDENFRNIISEWDFTTRDRVKEFKKDISKRLVIVGGDIDNLEKNRMKLDKRMDSLETKMRKLEGS
jgi:hypothetical protein